MVAYNVKITSSGLQRAEGQKAQGAKHGPS